MIPETSAVRGAARQLVRELQLLDSRHCIEGFTFSECHLITELEAMGQATATELAEILVLEKSTLSRLCDGLIRNGYISAKADSSDRRRKLLQLSRKGQSGAKRIHNFARGQVDTALSFVPEAERPALAEGLDRYSKGLRYARLSREFEIRKMKRKDNPAVARIIRRVMTEFGAVGHGYSINDPEVDDMYSAYPKPGSVFYVISKNGKILGCGGIGPLQGGEQGTCELRKMYFYPELRGTGMGTKLLGLCLEQARLLGYQTCYLETLESMSSARNLYRKHGFEPLEKPMGRTGHSACNAWMARSL